MLCEISLPARRANVRWPSGSKEAKASMSDHITESKCCRKCLVEYPRTLEFFTLDKSQQDELNRICKLCTRQSSSEWRVNNREKDRENCRRWRRENPEKSRESTRHWVENNFDIKKEYLKNWRKNNKTKISENSRRYAKEHPDKYKEMHKRWRLENIDKVREGRRKWAKHNPGKRRDEHKRWEKAHPELTKLQRQRRRARQHSLPATLTAREWQNILLAYDHHCAYCNRSEIEIGHKLHQDHVIPLVRGGGYTAENIVPACRSCNSRKGGRTPEQAGMILRRPVLSIVKETENSL